MDDQPRRRRRALLYDEPLPAEPAGMAKGDTVRPANGLSKIEERFCHYYTTHYNLAQAMIEAGYSPTASHYRARKLLQEFRIKQRIAQIESDRLRRIKFEGDKFLAHELVLATAPVTELVETWIPPCRYCWGINHEYQRTYAEFEEDYDAWMKQPDASRSRRQRPLLDGGVALYDVEGRKMPFDQRGGSGYNAEMPPNPACPNCYGRGNEDPERGTLPYQRIKDSRLLSDVGRMLYAGIRNGPRGIEQLVHDQGAARTRLMNMMGKFLELKAAGIAQQDSGRPSLGFSLGLAGTIAELLTDDPSSMSDQQLDAFLTEHGVVIDDGPTAEGEDSQGEAGERPPPGYVA